ncbi:hypothetical protein [Balneatrix alpica]|uniref:DUF2232 domain-containing protein n=1 Tax=Balneatrix alpica TaxID=75684 RepID=A0ABV5ZB85_9GAMM|nr:hypothetical protein [Balneatrix alpica]
MRALAEYIMRGRKEALVVAVVSAALPLMFWVSAATLSLVTLRRGVSEGAVILAWASLPTLAWWWGQGDPTPLLSLIGTFLLAWVLRVSVSWTKVLLVVSGLALVLSGILSWALADVLNILQTLSDQMLARMSPEGLEAPPEALRQFMMDLLLGGVTAFHLAVMLGSLALARSWQAGLYNPGGFQTEFHQLRLPLSLALGLVVVLFMGTSIDPQGLRWLPALTVPLVMAGLALVHGVIGIKALGRAWLVGFYTAFFLLGIYMYPLLMLAAVLDSAFNIRRRLRPVHSSDT